MPPKKLPPKTAKQQPSPHNASKPKATPKSQTAQTQKPKPQPIPEEDIKQSSGVSATLALEAAKKAYELRQAAYGAGDPNAREQILAKAINKEIEAESFGKAAKYTRSGAFQGLAAGAGLGVQPGVTLGKLTGALVGGVVSSVGALLGGGIGSAYGAISGPFWDLGEMASHGVRSIVGDFPNWEATSSQKKALEKMVLGAQNTKAPTEEELENMAQDSGREDAEVYSKWASDLTSYIPGMPSMPSIPGFGGQGKGVAPAKTTVSESAKSKQPAESAKPATRQQTQKTQQKPQQPSTGEPAKKRPRKLESKSSSVANGQPAAKKPPPKLGPKKQAATASA